MKQWIILALLCLGLSNSLWAQTIFRALLVDNEQEPVIGATIRWADSSQTAVTQSGGDGWFEIQRPDTLHAHQLQIEYIGYDNTFVEILPEENHLRLVLEASAKLQAVEVKAQQRASFTSTLQPINVEHLSSCELRRAACCSLAESFENNASVNISFSDAVTGAREIEMLGLRGTYTQMMVENRPSLNRLDRAYGMEYLPGTWLESIQISKGASTVRNGAQSITGIINVELLKPNKAEPFFANLFVNHLGRTELNLHFNTKLKNKWSTGLLLHGNYFEQEVDHNHDGFLDLPFKRQANALSRWLYSGDRLHFEFNVQGVLDGRTGGQTAALAQMHGSNQPYVIQTDVRRLEGFGKLGYFGFENPLQSLAMVYSATYHEQNSQIGLRQYQAKQKSLYWNGIFQTDLLRSKAHNTTWGITYQYDDFQEAFTDFSNNRIEQVLGAYGEYEWQKALDRGRAFGLILGLRADYLHTPVVQKVYVAPRFNAKYNFSDKTVLRASAGRGVRNVNVLMENLSFMASRRQFILQEAIRPEVAWNYGLNLVHQFRLLGQEGSVSVDAYRTDFENQLVADPYSNVEQISFYNLHGRSFANSFLVAYTQDLFKGFELRLAYKYNDVQSTYEGEREWQPFSPRHRGLVAVHYTTPKERWQFNANAQMTGQQRLPGVWGNLSGLPSYRQEAMAPSFTLFNAQITHYFPWGLDVYLGAENLGNYRQAQPILGYHDPFGTMAGNAVAPRFDAAAVYGPVMGTMIYAGLRYTLKPKKNAMPGHEDHEGHHHHDENIDESLYTKIEISTSAQCGMCKSSIEDKMYHLPGVAKAKLNLKDKKATIFYDAKQTNPNNLRKAISAMGYDADEVLGDPKAYEKLPDCCKKS